MKRCLGCWTTWDDAGQACPFCGGLRVDGSYQPSPAEDAVLAAIRGRLADLKAPLVAELRAIAGQSMPDETHLIAFEAHPGEFRREFAVQWDPFDAEVTQLDGGGALLAGAGPLIPPAVSTAPEFEKFPIASIAFHALPSWFAECWRGAGGHACRYPAFLSEHDVGMAFDLNRGRWDVHGERWPA